MLHLTQKRKISLILKDLILRKCFLPISKIFPFAEQSSSLADIQLPRAHIVILKSLPNDSSLYSIHLHKIPSKSQQLSRSQRGDVRTAAGRSHTGTSAHDLPRPDPKVLGRRRTAPPEQSKLMLLMQGGKHTLLEGVCAE